MPYKDPAKRRARQQSPEFKKRNYEVVKAWRARPENRAKRAGQARRWRERRPELWKEIHDRHREANLDQILARGRDQAKRRRDDPEYKEQERIAQRERNRRFKVKLLAEREAIAGRPKPKACEICHEDGFRIVWDHCHVEGHFRGWICDRCNRVLGWVKDDPVILMALIEYLANSKGAVR